MSPTFTTTGLDFSAQDVDKTIQLNVSWWQRLKYLFLRHILRRDVDPPGLFIITEVKTWSVTIEPAYICRGCKRTVPWSMGAADHHPELCDDCYAALDCPTCKARSGSPCDGGLHG